MSAMPPNIGLVGLGVALPEAVRSAADPVFDRLRAAGRLRDEVFFGQRTHRVLSPGESLSSLTVQAARAAMADAGIGPDDVDRFYGHLSPCEFVAPNEIYRVHRELELRRDMEVVPIQAEYNAFLLGLQHAWEAILCGRARRGLVAVGSGFTLQLDYAQEYASTVGDAAGAAVVGPSDRMCIVDVASETWSRHYGDLTVQPRPDAEVDHPLFRFEPGRMAGLLDTTLEAPPRLVERLLDRHGLTGSDITLIAHQNSRLTLDRWRERLKPRACYDTFEELGNMQFASVPVTLARYRHALPTDHLVLLAFGMAGNMTAALVRV